MGLWAFLTKPIGKRDNPYVIWWKEPQFVHTRLHNEWARQLSILGGRYRRANLGAQTAVGAGLQLNNFSDVIVFLSHDKINVVLVCRFTLSRLGQLKMECYQILFFFPGKRVTGSTGKPFF
jgi:hypothetical protein